MCTDTLQFVVSPEPDSLVTSITSVLLTNIIYSNFCPWTVCMGSIFHHLTVNSEHTDIKLLPLVSLFLLSMPSNVVSFTSLANRFSFLHPNILQQVFWGTEQPSQIESSFKCKPISPTCITKTLASTSFLILSMYTLFSYMVHPDTIEFLKS